MFPVVRTPCLYRGSDGRHLPEVVGIEETGMEGVKGMDDFTKDYLRHSLRPYSEGYLKWC